MTNTNHTADGLPSADDIARLARAWTGSSLRRPPLPALPAGHAVLPGATRLNRFYFMPETHATAAASPSTFQVDAVRRDFPALHQRVHGKPLIWLDNAATSQKPNAVIDAVAEYYRHDNSNVHRGAHALAARATDAYEGARGKVQRFLGAASAREIVFVRGTTEAINLVAQSYGQQHVGPGDEIVLTTLEHHANIVPWQFLCKEKGATLRVAPIDDRGDVRLDEYERLLGPRTKIVAFAHVSNVLGTVLPVQLMTAMAHRWGAAVVVDGAQAVPHLGVNVQALDCDFYAISGHKLYGPTGIGALYGKQRLLDAMPPWQGGGSMIRTVTFEETTFADAPQKFEAGTPIIAGAVGLGAAIDYLDRIGFDAAAAHEHAVTTSASQGLASVPGVRLVGTSPSKVSVLSFVIPGVPAEEIGEFLDREGIAVRVGHHCAQPTLRHFGLTAAVRPSLAIYNTHQEVEALVAAVHKARRWLL
jgi:SufS family cysteine desulfurase